MFHRIIFLLLIVSSLSCNFNWFAVNVFSRSWTSLAGVIKMPRVSDDSLLCWSVTLLIFIQTLHSLQPAGRSVHACFDRPEYWMSAVYISKLWMHSFRGLYDKNSSSYFCFTSDVMYKKIGLHAPRFVSKIL